MTLIVVRFPVRSELADEFTETVGPFTSATHAEPDSRWFGRSRGVESSNGFALIEASNDDATEAHVASDCFRAGLEAVCPFLTTTLRVISRVVNDDDWDTMGEPRID